jgi:SAM-dependent methyltransferase
MSTREHWDSVYAKKSPEEVSWYRPRLERSLSWIDGCGLDRAARVVDVGGGASTLVDDLLARGFECVSVVDLSARGLEHSCARLGDAAGRVQWLVGDATTRLFEDDTVDLWHDRAVFHFLVDEERRRAYVNHLRRCVRPGGFVIIATFGPGGPERCSGLPVARHAPAEVVEALGPGFELVDSAEEEHVTPAGTSQSFSHVLCRRRRP